MATQVIKRSPNFCHDTKRESGKTVAIQYFSQLHITAQHGNNPIGKDEVASSNLASSSIKIPKPFGFGIFICIDRFERSNAAPMSAAGDGWTEPNRYFCPQMAKMQTNLASSSKTKSPLYRVGFFVLIHQSQAASCFTIIVKQDAAKPYLFRSILTMCSVMHTSRYHSSTIQSC